MAKIITTESLNNKIATSTVAQKYAKRIGLLESARKVAGAAPMTSFEKYYAGQLFENIQKGSLYEGYTQGNFVGQNFKRAAFNIVSIAIQNTILPEIVSVQPMTTAAELIPILQLKYGTNKGETKTGDVVIDSTGAGRTDKNFDSMKIENAAITAGSTNYLTPFTPVTPGSIKIVDNGKIITDDGTGKLTNGGTVDYATGAVTLKTAATEGAVISYTYDNSMVPNYLYPELDGHGAQQVGDVTLGINPVLVEAEEHKLRAVYALTAAYKINKEYGVNMPLVFEQQVANEMNKERERYVMSDLFQNAAGGNAVVWSATPRPGVSDAEHAESLQIEINKAAAQVYTRTGGNLTVNYIVAGANVVAYMQKCVNFKGTEAPKNGGSFLAGTLGTLKVYQTPAIGTNDFFLGAIGNDFWQAGYVVGDYMPVTYTNPVTLADFTTQAGWVSMYGKKMVNANLYIRGRITV